MKNKSSLVLQHELWETAYAWLKQTGNPLNKNYCKQEITAHPDYPSLLSLTDFLESGSMSYRAIRSDFSSIHEFNYPLLVHIKQPTNQYMHMLENTGEWDKQKERLEHWSGIVLYPEENAKWQNEQYDLYRRNQDKQRVLPILFLLVALFLFSATTSRFGQVTGDHFFLIRTGLFGLLSLAGIVFSIAALGLELGLQNEISRQVCGTSGDSGCEKVLKSRFARGVAGITPADASALYFASQFILYLLSGLNLSILPALFLFSIGALAVAGWSLYTQAIRLRQWCFLCIALVLILTMQGIIAFTGFSLWPGLPSFPGLLSLSGFTILSGVFPAMLFGTVFILLTLVFIPVKQLLINNRSHKLQLAELKNWKSDAGLFLTEWEKEPQTDTTVWKNDLLLGDPSAPILITAACNPYCNPCARAHAKLDRLLQRFPGKIKILMRLTSNLQDADDKRTIAVKALLQRAFSTKNKKEIALMLTDWYKMMNYERWEAKWCPDKSINIQHRIKEHNDWMEQSKIIFTPTFFINGKKLPGRYSIDDIEFLIPQLAELENSYP